MKVWNKIRIARLVVIFTFILFAFSCSQEKSKKQLFTRKEKEFSRIVDVIYKYHNVIYSNDKCRKITDSSLNDKKLHFTLDERDLDFCYKSLNDSIKEKLKIFFERVDILNISYDTGYIEFTLPFSTNFFKDDVCVYRFVYVVPQSNLRIYLAQRDYVVATFPINTNWYLAEAIVPID
ncbi:MAG TPA: hypothetical protein VE978_03690 [Chitinophagales bacterium]|nr:hypothetical protein [Chitinophagales bacterium]